MSGLWSAGLGASAIPDSGLQHRYDWSDGGVTTTTVPDLVGSDDLEGQFTSLSESINGQQSGDFDVVDDLVQIDLSSTISTPVWVFGVARLDAPNSGDFETLIDGASSTGDNEFPNFRSNSADNWDLYDGSASATNGADDSNPHVFGFLSDSGGVTLRLDGVDEATTTNSPSMSALTVGAVAGGAVPGDYSVGEILLYDGGASSTIGDIESYLSDKWGIAI